MTSWSAPSTLLRATRPPVVNLLGPIVLGRKALEGIKVTKATKDIKATKVAPVVSRW